VDHVILSHQPRFALQMEGWTNEQFTVPYFQHSTIPQFQLVPFSSEHHLKPNTKHRRRVNTCAADPGQDEPRGNIDLVFLSPSDDL
jgi:hypothetical protein